MSEKFKLQPGEKIEKITVPDEEVVDWIRTLQEGGMSSEEIDLIMSNLNQTYAGKKQSGFIENEFMKIRDQLLEKHNRELSPEEEKEIRRGIASRFT